jgi:hypothetical protein
MAAHLLPRHPHPDAHAHTHESDAHSASTMAVFQTSIHTALYSAGWTPSNTGTYAATCIFLVVLATLFRGLLALDPSRGDSPTQILTTKVISRLKSPTSSRTSKSIHHPTHRLNDLHLHSTAITNRKR